MYRVIATVYQTSLPITVRASIQKDGVELASATHDCSSGIPEELLLKVPSSATPGRKFKLRIEGNLKGVLEGTSFIKEANLQFLQRSMTIFITTSKPIYMQGQTVKFRCVPITTDLRTFSDAVDVFMIDPHGNTVKRWLSRQSNLGKFMTMFFKFVIIESYTWIGQMSTDFMPLIYFKHCMVYSIVLLKFFFLHNYHRFPCICGVLIDSLLFLLGTVSLEYPLSTQPIYGNWTIKVVAQGQEETKQYLVEEYCEYLIELVSSH